MSRPRHHAPHRPGAPTTGWARRRPRSRPAAALLLTSVLACTVAGTPASASPADGAPPTGGSRTGVDVVTEWYDITAATIAAAGAPTQVTNSRTWAIGWLAAARATRSVPAARGGGPYGAAALASAVRTTLVTLVPARADEVDAAFAGTLARLPDGTARDRGVAAGQAEARALIAARTGDGLDPASVNAPFATPAPAVGVWQPTPPAFVTGQQFGNRDARPFLLAAADEFRLPPPPAVGSEGYRADLDEVRTYGAADSTARSAAQTDVAQFWFGSSLVIYTGVLRAALTAAPRSLAQRARLVALFHVALVDTQIATSDSKYAYVTWRPVTAIRAGADPQWTPLHVTPAHPDYPSGHNTYSGAAERILTALVGPTVPAFTIDSPSAPGVTRTYTSWRPLTTENTDARVFSGIHTRTADTAGVLLGDRVADNVLRRADRLFP